MVACRNYGYTGEIIGANPDLEPEEARKAGWDSAKIAQFGPAALKAGQNGPQPSVAQRARDLLDMIGLVPGLGEPAHAINCGFYGAEGQGGDAALSCAAAFPVLGWLANIFKGIRHADDAAKAGQDVAEAADAGKIPWMS
ncbi:hypothetical protein [Amycolatopsis sp. 3B14]|uniref:hypothetical protein n=1 Tax=Amycolatopsis sp. 3B14 TaxID=3243600 RepID=UPI003D97334E